MFFFFVGGGGGGEKANKNCTGKQKRMCMSVCHYNTHLLILGGGGGGGVATFIYLFGWGGACCQFTPLTRVGLRLIAAPIRPNAMMPIGAKLLNTHG